ncbi:hypothetical protein FKM82_025077 [Ascaphus truei]
MAQSVKRGRHSGGIIIWYKEELKSPINTMKRGDTHMWLQIKGSMFTHEYDTFLCAAYIPLLRLPILQSRHLPDPADRGNPLSDPG